MTIPFVPRIDHVPRGTVQRVHPLVERIIAGNPSKFTYHGTGTYIVGNREVVVIDPGPVIDAHRDAIAAALQGRSVVAIAVTHCHSDHSPLAEWLHGHTGAPRVAIGPHRVIEGWTEDDDFDPSEEIDDADMHDDAEAAEERETIDLDFAPDVAVGDGDVVARTTEFTMRAVATPGHTSNHMCLSVDEDAMLFTGDHVMGWSTTVVAPPDGDMADYIASLHKVRGRGDRVLWPTHGGPVTDPGPFLDAYLAHRLERERGILEQIRLGNDTIPGIVGVLYADVHRRLHRPARRSVWSHLRKLHSEGLVVPEDGEGRLLGRWGAV